MADFLYNVAKGRVAELCNRVNDNDPTNAALIVVVIDANAVSDATLKDVNDLGAILALAVNEVTNTNYARKTLTDSSSIVVTINDSNDSMDVDFPDQTFSAIAAGDSWEDLLVCYDSDTTGGTDANIIPLTQHDFAVTPDGSDITAELNSVGFFRAS